MKETNTGTQFILKEKKKRQASKLRFFIVLNRDDFYCNIMSFKKKLKYRAR